MAIGEFLQELINEFKMAQISFQLASQHQSESTVEIKKPDPVGGLVMFSHGEDKPLTGRHYLVSQQSQTLKRRDALRVVPSEEPELVAYKETWKKYLRLNEVFIY